MWWLSNIRPFRYTRHPPIAQTVANIRPDTLIIPDAYGWADPGIREQALPGFASTYFQPLNDKWLQDTEGEHMQHIGVAFATNAKHEAPTEVDLDGRRCTKVILDVGKYGIAVYAAYLNHAREDMRTEQLQALVSDAKKSDIPTIVAGDLNAQVALKHVSLREKSRSAFVRLMALAFNSIGHPHGPVLADLERREALSVLDQADFHNFATHHGPTALTKAPFFRVDHIYGRGVTAGNYTVHREDMAPGTSDHWPVSVDLTIPS